MPTSRSPSLILLMIVVLASLLGYRAGIVCAVSAYLSLNYFFTPPRYSLRVYQLEDLLPLLVFALVATVLGATVGRVNALRQQAEAREHEALEARMHAAVEEERAGFLSAMTHNLRTPLGGIKAVVTTLRSPDVHLTHEEEHELLEVAFDETDRLERLVTKVLELSRIRAGVLDVQYETVDIGDLTREAVHRLHHLAIGHEIRLEVGGGIPLALVDPAMMEVVMVSLLENAIRFAPPDSEVLVRVAQANSGIDVRVVDHGPGIAEADRERMFEAFERGPRPSDGTGLGLAIARAFVEAQGGTIRIEETPGGGATFVVYLPRGEPT